MTGKLVNMFTSFFPLKKLRRSGKYLLFIALLMLGAFAFYHELVAANNTRRSTKPGFTAAENRPEGRPAQERVVGGDKGKGFEGWRSSFTPQLWRPEFKGEANLHVFEDWCGSSTAQLRQNLHYPLYPHSRTTVKKLAISPRWTNYGLRIFGYLHPYANGEFVFAVSSDDNSEFWLSWDDSPLNLQLLVWIGKTGTEWSAPGEFEKYASQTSRPVRLLFQRRYFFEIVHKQNDRGTDHVELAWRLNQEGQRFTVVSSNDISLYTNDSSLRMDDVAHIPQTAASHALSPSNRPVKQPVADMLRDDPRDTLYQIPPLKRRYLNGVLPDCSYKPSYVIKGFPLMRYQGLQFVHMSYIYPNDYTRLTHMETHNTCFYHDNPTYLKRIGFSRYMRMDEPTRPEGEEIQRDVDILWRRNVVQRGEALPNVGGAREKDNAPSDYGDDFDDYTQRRQRKLFSLPRADRAPTPRKPSDPHINRKRRRTRRETKASAVLDPGPRAHRPINTTSTEKLRSADSPAEQHRPTRTQMEKYKPGQHKQVVHKLVRRPAGAKQSKDRKTQQLKLAKSLHQTTVAQNRGQDLKAGNVFQAQAQIKSHRQPGDEERVHSVTVVPEMNGLVEGIDEEEERRWERAAEGRDLWGLGRDSEEGQSYDSTFPPVFDPEVNWAQTFQLTPVDLQAMRSDWIDLRCNVSGNLLLRASGAMPLVKAFMDKLHTKHHGRFSLVRVLNIERRVDGAQGSRYFLELELRDRNGQHVRLSHYIYALIRPSRSRNRGLHPVSPEMLLCNPVGFQWNPTATVHVIVPVKNQARWVQQLIVDMEALYQSTGDPNFNLIITDYNSTDMDIEKALTASKLHRFQYLKLNGNFERSAGLQAGIDLITDEHSIVFLCDLHLHFPTSIIDSVRKHCVEGYMAFAPIVMRLDCGATPRDPRGYWEVNGFGLLGIYKSDLEAAGGMNTQDFTDRWGGEDWELLDRVLQSGLEVERIYLRNFCHFYHSKRGMWNRRTQHSGT
ncbi:hypothetical protein DPEC_G00166110 [Dallia pectoralis]|uniref:Uncharacterized protein n=1 Tax=Dallia pectoralis TaxID=75939 RepID=A0ACC2GHP1_DALPE|nr:hypothetical protein DPEC_G00166110 [Dallia pectoralis]